jgi:imidazolonepropionase-like amidohydrolase
MWYYEVLMKRSLRIFLYTAIVATVPIQFAQQAPAPTPGAIAIQHVTVIDIETGGRSADQTVVISGNRIAAAGPSAKVKTPAGARVIDGTGKFLIPGLWEAHFHAIHVKFEQTLPIAVARGITDARDMGAPIPYLLEARKAIGEGLLAPRLFVAGPELDGAPSPYLTAFFPPGEDTVVNTPEEGRQLVDRLADLKVDFIKIHNEVKRDVYYAVAEEAKRKGLMFAGHLPPEVGIVEASDAGQRTIEHMNGLAAVCAANPADLRRPAANAPAPTEPIQIDQAKCEDAARHLARNGTFFSPTPLGAPGQGPKRMREFNVKIVSIASKAGVRLLAGTDWPGPSYMKGNYSSFDRTPQDELAGFVEAGLTPLEALRTATLNPAILFNKTDELGSVRQGKLADLDLLDADPLVDITNTTRIAAVIVNGRLVDAAERKKLLDAEAARRSAAGK